MEKLKRIDPTIIVSAQGGDEQAVENLYPHLLDLISPLVYRTQITDGAELTREITAKILLNLSKYERRADVPFEAWAVTVARNASIDQIRKNEAMERLKSRMAIAESIHNSSSPVAPDTGLDGEKLWDLLDVGGQYLTEDQLYILECRAQGLSFRDISERTGKSEAAAKKLRERGIVNLRRSLPQFSALFEKKRKKVEKKPKKEVAKKEPRRKTPIANYDIQLVRLLSEHKTTDEIANILGYRAKVITRQLLLLKEYVNVKNTAQLVKWFQQNGFL